VLSLDVPPCKLLAPAVASSFDLWIQRRSFRLILVNYYPPCCGLGLLHAGWICWSRCDFFAADNALDLPQVARLRLTRCTRGCSKASHRLITSQILPSHSTTHSLTCWKALCRYPDGGGWKSTTSSPSALSGERAVIIYSLIEGCKLNHIDPQGYLQYVLERIADHPIYKIDQLLPWSVANKINQPEQVTKSSGDVAAGHAKGYLVVWGSSVRGARQTWSTVTLAPLLTGSSTRVPVRGLRPSTWPAAEGKHGRGRSCELSTSWSDDSVGRARPRARVPYASRVWFGRGVYPVPSGEAPAAATLLRSIAII
jgi:IS66 C-terminal element